ncbi:hypothetical protein COCMIDRAFT_34681 [Bipolaris oryzae ATCC 44560]|uniref:Heterokaryon incompatibility domain-containing protein n=1 Tax=Bipolaris oryzae ATCC 44560 TaxID=930090 RepID=W6ZVI4_COCMI|nr:uncharacterized protein COCMIDRAFT_34681 [Bipolaris oryzae ATCC 44560]EUC47771.1 hypothetical protein COCMIDRAFT_34681 [Bipolaris oryzae ATCC 44560]
MEVSITNPPLLGQYLHEANFQYSDSIRDQHIRLLDLKFGHDDEIISLGIETYEVNDHPPYTALSYTWGDAKDTASLLCNGKTIAATRNLYEALWQFRENRKRLARLKPYTRSHSQTLLFWIDAICINQENNREKSFQVGLMREIYEWADHVFVWLGPADKSSEVAIRCINTVGSKAESCGFEDAPELGLKIWHEIEFVSGGYQRVVSANPWYGKAMKSLFDSISGRSSQSNLLPITDLRNFFTRPWWTRIWVLQEAALSRDTHFICGAERLSRTRCNAFIHMYAAFWKANATAFQREQAHFTQYRLDIMRLLFHHPPTLMLTMPKIHRHNAFQLVALLRATCVGSINLKQHGPHNLQATRPEDKIFALLGLAADRDELKRFGVVPNYDIPYEQTYTTTMVALLRQGHISLLSMCQPSQSPNLPSWVPDWSRSITDMLQDVRNDHMTLYPEFSASGPPPTNTKNSIKIIKEAGIIKHISLHSILFDEIHQIGHFPTRTTTTDVPFQETYTWPSQWLLEILRLTYCPTATTTATPNKPRYKRFHDRLSAATRTATGDVARNTQGEFERAGPTHLSDAIILLHHGLQFLRPGRCKVEARRFLSAQKTLTMTLADRVRHEIPLAFQITGRSLGRVPFVTRRGHLGLGSDEVRVRDAIAVVEGAQVPFVLRAVGGGRYSLVGEAYVDGVMDGEVVASEGFGYVTLV